MNRSDEGSILGGLLTLALVMALTAALFWGALWLDVRGVLIALSALGFLAAGVLVVAAVALVVGLLRSEESAGTPRFWPYIAWGLPVAVCVAGTWWFWSAARSSGMVAFWTLCGSFGAVLAGWAVLSAVMDRGPRVRGS